MSRHALFLCRDDVTTKVSLSRSRRPRQEVKVATSLVLGKDLCQDKVFLGRDRVWSRLRALCHEFFLIFLIFIFIFIFIFYVATELANVKRIYVTTEYPYVATEFGLDGRF